MVVKGEKTSAINLILTAKRYCHFQSVIAVTELSAAAVGAGLLVFKKKDMNKKEGHFFYRINIALWK